jgi:uncharacterized protein (TIGR03790 family)
VIYNKNLPESKKLAEYYAQKRGVPAKQLFAVDVSPTADALSRTEFRDKLQQPIFKWLAKEDLLTVNPKPRRITDTMYHPILDARIRYLVLSYGIPWRIARDGSIKDDGAEKLPDQLRGRNEAAVDADLALLPGTQQNLPLTGPLINPFYLTTNAAQLHPANGLLMVARLDGPSVEIARGLIDKAMLAETNGLWGHAYIDSRGITNGEYKVGDDWMRSAANVTRRAGFDTVFDEQEATFPAAMPLSQVAFYAGWYDLNASGPFTRPTVEFMPGAFAYHLHSYSANQLRSTTQYWTGALLAKGATITLGTVDEPYLPATPNIAVIIDRLVAGRWTFGEAAYAGQSALSWQTTVVGDPLYRPFGQNPEFLHFKLEREKNPLIEWSHLRVVNLNLATGTSLKDATNYIANIASVSDKSAVLQEKLGSLLLGLNDLPGAAAAYARASKLNPSPQQKIRLLLALGGFETQLNRDNLALDTYTTLVTSAPDYPDNARLYREMARLADKLGKKSDADKFNKEAQRLAK